MIDIGTGIGLGLVVGGFFLGMGLSELKDIGKGYSPTHNIEWYLNETSINDRKRIAKLINEDKFFRWLIGYPYPPTGEEGYD